MDAVDLAADERIDRRTRDLLRMVVGQLREQVDLLVDDLELAPRVEIAPAPADQSERDLAIALVDDEGAGRLDDVGVEAAAQAAIRGDHEEQ